MLAAPFLVRERAHVSMELIDSALSAAGRQRLISFTDIICAATSSVIAYFAASAGYTAWVRGEIDIQAIDVPRWIMFAVLTVGFSMCAIEFLRHLRRAFTQGVA